MAKDLSLMKGFYETAIDKIERLEHEISKLEKQNSRLKTKLNNIKARQRKYGNGCWLCRGK